MRPPDLDRGPSGPPSSKNLGGILLGGFFPGFLAGTQLAGLLFFLNPQIPFDPPVLVEGLLFSGIFFGLVGFAAFAVACRGRLRKLWRWLPSSLTAVLILASSGYWIHAHHFGFYLPPGINTRLLKAAVALSVAALVCFYTMVLHRLRRRPYGPRSRLLFTAMALLSIYVIVERREAFRPRLEPEPRPSTFVGDPRPFLCVVGLETATLDAILPLAEEGRLPFFARLLEEGVQARIDPLDPIRRDPLWTTLATGRYPYRHGIVGDQVHPAIFLPTRGDAELRLLPIGFDPWFRGAKSARPVTRRDLEVPPIWRIASRLKMSVAVVGWPVTDPPEDGMGIVLSEQFFAGPSIGDARHVTPSALAERARLFRTPMAEIDPGVASRFGAHPPMSVLRSLRQDLWREDLAFYLLGDRETSLDALFLTLPGLRQISEDHYGGYSAVQFQGSTEEESVASSRLVSAYYAHLDDFLAELWEAMREPGILAVVSTHGMASPGGLREARRVLLRRPAKSGAAGGDGVMMLLGQGIRAGGRVRAELVDPVPTLLYGLGFPVARDLDGAVLTDVFDTSFLAQRPLTFVPSYESLESWDAP